MEDFAESIRLGPDVFVQASARGFRVSRLSPWDPAPCPENMLATGDTAVMRQLLAGAFYAGHIGSKSAATQSPAMNLLRHIHGLAGAYQTTHATPQTMRRAAKRLAAKGQHAAAARCMQVAREESGHDTLALMDLAALGLPAHDLVARLRPPGHLALVEWFNQLVDSDEPVAVLGYVYYLERNSLFLTEASLAAMQRMIPAGVNATRCARVHSAVGSDADHVAESTEFMASLPAHDRALIATTVYRTGALLAQTESYPGDEEMAALLREFQWERESALPA